MQAFLAKLKAFFLALLPVKWNLDKVPAAVEAEATKVMDEAKVKVAHIKAGHSVKEIKDKLDTDVAHIKDVLARVVTHLEAEAKVKVDAATAVLPPVVLPPVTPPSA